jgi:hypothetical protein
VAQSSWKGIDSFRHFVNRQILNLRIVAAVSQQALNSLFVAQPKEPALPPANTYLPFPAGSLWTTLTVSGISALPSSILARCFA